MPPPSRGPRAQPGPYPPAAGQAGGSVSSAPSGTFLTGVAEQAPVTVQKQVTTALAVKGGEATSGKADRAKATKDFVNKHCRSDVSEEWKKVDDKKIAKLRGILAALQEENQSTQLLKKESENAEARRELEATRTGVEARLLQCKEREATFVKKQADLRRHVLENEKALQELETNIEKGEKKSRDEQAECRALDLEVASLEAELEQQEVVKAAEQKKIVQTSQYKKFLEAVVQEGCDDFEGDIENLMNRHSTLEAGNKELHEISTDLSRRLDAKREEALRVQTTLQNQHLMISSQLHECQVTLDRQRADVSEMEQRLNRALEEKELKESQVGVIQMAIEQLFTRTVMSCRLKQRKKAMTEAVDIKYAPIRGDKGDLRLEEMLKQIIERITDLREMHQKATEELGKQTSEQQNIEVQEADPEVKFVQATKEERAHRTGHAPHSSEENNSEHLTAGTSSLRRLQGSETSGGSGGGGAVANVEGKFSADVLGD